MTKVYIDGAHGTTGLSLASRLANREDIELLTVSDADYKNEAVRSELMHEADVVFLCLPDAAAVEAASLAGGTVVIDTSTAHRTAPGWAYGLPELSAGHKAAIAGAARIANPGCHATGFIVSVYPLVAAGVLPADALLTCFSLTGYSGGGKKMIAEYEAADRAHELAVPRQYALGMAHKHLPEMQHVCGLTTAPAFMPEVCDFYSGMAVSVPLHASQLAKKLTVADVKEIFTKHYAGSKVISVCDAPESGFLPADGMRGTDALALYVLGGGETVQICAVFDNLGKGAAGAAVQNMNIATGASEYLSLRLGDMQ